MAERRAPGGRTRRAVVSVGAVLLLAAGIGPPAAAQSEQLASGAAGGRSSVPASAAAPVRQVTSDPQIPVNPDLDDDRTRARADEILARSEYQPPEPSGESAGGRISEWLRDRFPSFDGGPALGNLAWVVVIVVGLGTLAVITWVLATSSRRRRPPDDEEVDASVEVAPLRSPREWADEAARCTAAGDHRGAVRAHFRTLTSTLAERRLVADTPGRTVGELRHDVAELTPDTVATFGAAADLFEGVWFGHRPAGPEESERAATLARDALRSTPRRPAARADDGPAGPTGADDGPDRIDGDGGEP